MFEWLKKIMRILWSVQLLLWDKACQLATGILWQQMVTVYRIWFLSLQCIHPGVCAQSHMIFPVVTYSSESWTVKKPELQRIDTFKLWCWRRLLKVSWAARRSNQSILKEINPEYWLEGLMLKLQYSGPLTWRADSLEKSLMLGKIEGRRRRGH